MLIAILKFAGLAVAAHAIERTYDSVADRIRGNKLSNDLAETIREWAGALPEYCVPETLIAILFAPPLGEMGPARADLRTSLADMQLPSAEVWFAALYERWSEIRASGPDVQPFFGTDPSFATGALRDLADRLERIARTDPALFQVEMIGMTRLILEKVDQFAAQSRGRAPMTTPEIAAALETSATALLQYPSTVTPDKRFIARPEIPKLLETFAASPSSATVLIAERGAGKSALLARVANEAIERGWGLLGIKADLLPSSMTVDSIQEAIGIDTTVVDAIRRLASERKVIALIEDAIAEVSDRKTDRLNILLNIVHRLSRLENVHVVLSSREFEFRTDSRLTSLQFDEVRLDLLPFEAVMPILIDSGHQPSTFGDVLRDLLRNPLALKLFLDVARPHEEFASLGALLERFWSMNVTGATNAVDRATLLERAATRMTEEEHLSVPIAIADDLPEALRGLLAAGMLISDGGSLSFRHQTFYEFTVARRFARGEADLVMHVIERQDGLFVRPTILSTLTLLRELSQREYTRVVTALLTDRSLRSHVRALITDFLGSQRDPLPVEVSLVLPLLDDETQAPRVLNAVAGSPGWFSLLRNDKRFLRWLIDPAQAFRCLSMMTAAVLFDRAAALSLLTEHWLKNAAFDHLVSQVIRQLDQFDDQSLRIVRTVVGRTSSAAWLVEHVATIGAAHGAQLLGEDFDRRIRETCEALKDVYEPEVIRHAFEKVVDKDDRHDLFGEIAENAADEFLAATWRRFLQVAEFLMMEVNDRGVTYRRSFTFDFDRGPVPEGPLVAGLRIAIRKVAATNPGKFLRFLDENSASEFLIVHELLAEGLDIISTDQPLLVCDYLLEDPRRLSIGVENERYTTSARLIRSIHPRLHLQDRRRLQTAIVEFDAHVARTEDDVEKRTTITRWNRYHRFGLLDAIDRGAVEPELRLHITAEERFFGGPLTPRPGVEVYWVGPRMKKEEIEKASDADVMNLMNHVTDDAPRHEWTTTIERERSGGADQLANEIAKAVEESPERALRFVHQLDPAKHQTYAGPLMEAAIKAGADLEDLAPRIKQLDERGFRTEEFRGTVGWALHERAKVGGLPDSLIGILERWLEERPSEKESDVEAPRERQREPIVAGYHLGTWRRRENLLAGYSAGLLRRSQPDTRRWIATIRRLLPRERALSFWSMAIGQMAPCLNADRPAANALLSDIVAANPLLLEQVSTILYLGNFTPALEIGNVRRWLHEMRSSSSAIARQGWGELLLLQRERSDAEAIEKVLAGNDIDAILGLSYGATYVWSPERVTAAAILSSAADKRWGTEFIDPIARALRDIEDDPEKLDEDSERFIRSVIANPSLVEKLPTDLLAVIQPRATMNARLSYDVTKTLLEVGATHLSNPADIFSAHAGDLTTLALTLHRQPEFRAQGLELFERLIALNLHEAEAALELLDRRASRRYAQRAARRRIPRRGRRARRNDAIAKP
jgi:hypothetical protein